jgi:glucose/arabinose dehydrogenase
MDRSITESARPAEPRLQPRAESWKLKATRDLRGSCAGHGNGERLRGRTPVTSQLLPRNALALCAGLLAAWPAFAQQSAPASPLFGRPTTAGAMQLAPIVPPVSPTAADKLPVDRLKIAKGFKIEVYMSGVADARSLRQGDKGTVFVSTRRSDKVYAIVENRGRRELKTIASGLHRPNGIAFKDGTLYVAEVSRVSKLERIEDNLDSPPNPVPIYDDLPKDERHGWKFIAIGPDNKLYVPVGAPCNICMPSDAHGQLRRIDLDGSGMEVIARGIRNTVGFDWHPQTKQLYFTDNGRDWLSEDVPEDELNRISEAGQNFGFPYCHQGDFLDPEFGWGRSCDEFERPVLKTGPHSASLGMRFYTGSMFPAKYKNAIFIARHGSWNRTKKFGGDILVVFLNPNGTVKATEVLVSGFIGPDNNYIGRPVDVLFLKDGSMLISDDYNGAVWRVTYGTQKNPAQN